MAIKINLILIIVIILFLTFCILNVKNEYYESSKFKVSLIEKFLNESEINTLLSDCNNFRNSTIISDNGNVISNFRTSKTRIKIATIKPATTPTNKSTVIVSIKVEKKMRMRRLLIQQMKK